MVVVVTRPSEGVVQVMLNRPDAMNALSDALRAGLAETMAALDADAEVGAIILTGSGRAFCAGLDLKELSRDVDQLDPDAPSSTIGDLMAAVDSCQTPIVGAVNGVAITGGFELALACDILIGSVDARFADTHARIGVLPGWGLSQKLSRRIGPSRAKEMSLTGNFIDAQTAHDWGLLNHVVPADRLLDRAIELAKDIAGVPGEMVVAYKALIDRGYAMTLDDAVALERTVSTDRNIALQSGDIERNRSGVFAHGRAKTRL